MFTKFSSITKSGETAPISLVFICRENPRLSGILLFCRPMKTRNRRYPWSSGMIGDKSRESGVFLFSWCVPDFCDGRLSFPIIANWNLYGWGHSHYQSLKLLGSRSLSNKHGISLNEWWIWDRPLRNIQYISKIWDGLQKVTSWSTGIFPTWKPGFITSSQSTRHPFLQVIVLLTK